MFLGGEGRRVAQERLGIVKRQLHDLRNCHRADVGHPVARHVDADGIKEDQVSDEIEDGGYDLVVLGLRGRGRLTSELFGSANGYVHFHSRIPLLSISGEKSNGDVAREAALAGSSAH